MSENEKSGEDSGITPDSPIIGKSITFVFCWIMIGFSLIYGIRLYYNDPIHPTFIPIAGGVFSATLAFAIVMTLRYVSGNITLRIAGTEYKGATGPIILWCLCFICIVFGLNMIGIADTTQIPYASTKTRSITELLLGK